MAILHGMSLVSMSIPRRVNALFLFHKRKEKLPLQCVIPSLHVIVLL